MPDPSSTPTPDPAGLYCSNHIAGALAAIDRARDELARHDDAETILSVGRALSAAEHSLGEALRRLDRGDEPSSYRGHQ